MASGEGHPGQPRDPLLFCLLSARPEVGTGLARLAAEPGHHLLLAGRAEAQLGWGRGGPRTGAPPSIQKAEVRWG